MKFYTTEIVEKVRKERKKGLSLRALEAKFGVPNSTISKWVRDINSKQTLFNKARTNEISLRHKFSDLAKTYKINKDIAKIFISLLYWCEGSKYPATNCIAFSNSDYKLVKTFLQLLRKAFEIKENKLKARLQIHTTHDYQKVLKIWSQLLKIPVSQFYKPTITKPTNRMKRQNYIGTCTIKYYDVKLLLNIIGLYESFAQKYTRRDAGVV